MDEGTKTAIITAIPPTVTALAAVVISYLNHRKISTVEINTNDKLTQILGQRNAATSRADIAQGRQDERDATNK
jgi:hypothetical protein